jgi:DNA-binding NtrC family response regulator
MERGLCVFKTRLKQAENPAIQCSSHGPRDLDDAFDEKVGNEDHIVLVVDDDLLIRRMLERYLRKIVGAVFVARNAAEAHAAIGQYPINILVCDFDLGKNEPNGVQLTTALRRQNPRIQRAFIFSAIESSNIPSSNAVDEVLSKGIHLQRLGRLVQRRFDS